MMTKTIITKKPKKTRRRLEEEQDRAIALEQRTASTASTTRKLPVLFAQCLAEISRNHADTIKKEEKAEKMERESSGESSGEFILMIQVIIILLCILFPPPI